MFVMESNIIHCLQIYCSCIPKNMKLWNTRGECIKKLALLSVWHLRWRYRQLRSIVQWEICSFYIFGNFDRIVFNYAHFWCGSHVSIRLGQGKLSVIRVSNGNLKIAFSRKFMYAVYLIILLKCSFESELFILESFCSWYFQWLCMRYLCNR